LTYHSKSHPAEEKSSLKGAWSGLGEPFQNFTPHVISPQRLTLETSDFVHGSAMQSLSLVMNECFLSGRGQGHVSNFYIVDLENLVYGLSLAAIIQRWLGETPFVQVSTTWALTCPETVHERQCMTTEIRNRSYLVHPFLTSASLSFMEATSAAGAVASSSGLYWWWWLALPDIYISAVPVTATSQSSQWG